MCQRVQNQDMLEYMSGIHSPGLLLHFNVILVILVYCVCFFSQRGQVTPLCPNITRDLAQRQFTRCVRLMKWKFSSVLYIVFFVVCFFDTCYRHCFIRFTLTPKFSLLRKVLQGCNKPIPKGNFIWDQQLAGINWCMTLLCLLRRFSVWSLHVLTCYHIILLMFLSKIFFLSSQASFNLPPAMNFDPYTPRINLDSKKVKTVQAFAVDLKAHLSEILKQPVEARLPTGEHTC